MGRWALTAVTSPAQRNLVGRAGPGLAMHVLAALWRRWERRQTVSEREREGTNLVTEPASLLGPGSSQHGGGGELWPRCSWPGRAGLSCTLLGAQRHSVIPEGDYSQVQVQNHPEHTRLLGDYPLHPCDFTTEASPRPLWWEGGPWAGVRLAGGGFTSSLTPPPQSVLYNPLSHLCFSPAVPATR